MTNLMNSLSSPPPNAYQRLRTKNRKRSGRRRPATRRRGQHITRARARQHTYTLAQTHNTERAHARACAGRAKRRSTAVPRKTESHGQSSEPLLEPNVQLGHTSLLPEAAPRRCAASSSDRSSPHLHLPAAGASSPVLHFQTPSAPAPDTHFEAFCCLHASPSRPTQSTTRSCRSRRRRLPSYTQVPPQPPLGEHGCGAEGLTPSAATHAQRDSLLVPPTSRLCLLPPSASKRVSVSCFHCPECRHPTACLPFPHRSVTPKPDAPGAHRPSRLKRADRAYSLVCEGCFGGAVPDAGCCWTAGMFWFLRVQSKLWSYA